MIGTQSWGSIFRSMLAFLSIRRTASFWFSASRKQLFNPTQKYCLRCESICTCFLMAFFIELYFSFLCFLDKLLKSDSFLANISFVDIFGGKIPLSNDGRTFKMLDSHSSEPTEGARGFPRTFRTTFFFPMLQCLFTFCKASCRGLCSSKQPNIVKWCKSVENICLK